MRASTRPRMNLTWRLSGRFSSQASTNPRLRNWSRYWIGTSRSKLNQSGLKERLRSHCSSQAATSHFRKRIRGRPERTLSMIAAEQQYPWYSLAEGDDLEQGDILESCRVFSPPADLADDSRAEHATFGYTERDVIVMSQSCDLVKGRNKLTEVLLCALWRRSECTEGHLSTPRGWEDARRGNLPAYHVLSECDLPTAAREVRIVDFRRIYPLPIDFVRRHAASARRIRLLPPYREHLSQAFARYFMRVGLPVDIPPFK